MHHRSSVRVGGIPALQIPADSDPQCGTSRTRRPSAPAASGIYAPSRSAGRSRYSASDSGLASASTFATGAAVDRLPHGDLGDLAADRAGDVGHLRSPSSARGAGSRARGCGRGCARAAGRRASTPSRSRTNSTTRTSPEARRLPDHDALDHLRQLLHLPVDLRRADAHARRVQRRVAPAVDDQPVVRRELRPVAVTPDAREVLEVRGAIARAVGIVPERRPACSGTARVHTSSPASPHHRPTVSGPTPRPPCRARAPAARRATPAASGRRARSTR